MARLNVQIDFDLITFETDTTIRKSNSGRGFAFSSNYLFGVVDRWIVGPTKFKLYFYNGGCRIFLRVLMDLLSKHRSSAVGRSSVFVTNAQAGMVQQEIQQVCSLHVFGKLGSTSPTNTFCACRLFCV